MTRRLPDRKKGGSRDIEPPGGGALERLRAFEQQRGLVPARIGAASDTSPGRTPAPASGSGSPLARAGTKASKAARTRKKPQ